MRIWTSLNTDQDPQVTIIFVADENLINWVN